MKNRADIFSLLPAYISGDLSARDRRRVEAAASESADVREAIAEFRSLETLLAERRDAVPSAAKFLDALPTLTPVAGESRATAWLHRLLNVLVSGPGIAVTACLTVAGWTYWNREAINAFFTSGTAQANAAENISQSFATALTTLAGNDLGVAIAGCAIVTLGILAFTGAMTLRFLRS